MKSYRFLSVFVCCIFMLTIANAQDNNAKPKYLFQNANISVSGFAAGFAEFSSIQGDFALSAGGEAAFIFGNAFYIGGYGMGLSTRHFKEGLDTIVNINSPVISFNHAGFWLGYLYKSNKIFHPGISTKIGWGNISLFDRNSDPDFNADKATDRVMVITPQIELDINLTNWLKINIGAGFRFVTGIDKTYKFENSSIVNKYYDLKDFNSPIGTVTIIIGGFGKKAE